LRRFLFAATLATSWLEGCAARQRAAALNESVQFDASTAASTTDARPMEDSAAPMTAQARCDLLLAQSRAALQRHREQSERIVQTLVAQHRDPLARMRAAYAMNLANNANSMADGGATVQAVLEPIVGSGVAFNINWTDTSGNGGSVVVRVPDTLVNDHVRRQLPGVEPAPNNPHELSLAPGDLCAPYAGGAWGFVITSAQSFPSEHRDWSHPWLGGALVALAHIDSSGAIATNADIHTSMDQGTDHRPPEVWPEQPSRWNCCNDIAGTWENIVRYDFDHDEVPHA
jgi:hypothetical protein